MNKHGFKHVRKINDGRPKPYFGRIWFKGEARQIGGGHATAREAHEAAVEFLEATRHVAIALPSQQCSTQGE